MVHNNKLSVENLNCIRGERVLFEGLNFNLSAGTALHVKGANGSGKTSLLRLICGISQIDQGTIDWNGVSTKSNYNFLQRSAYIGHKDGLKNELSCIENLRIYQKLHGGFAKHQTNKHQQNEQKLDDCLAQLRILHCADLNTHQLSFGQRRRLAFARVLLNPFDFWVLDEPFTGIDQEGRELIESICDKHLSSGGLIALTHHQSLANSAFAERLSSLELSPKLSLELG